MTKEYSWQRFMETGHVADYLAYVEESRQSHISREDYLHTYAGYRTSDGNDSQSRTDS